MKGKPEVDVAGGVVSFPAHLARPPAEPPPTTIHLNETAAAEVERRLDDLQVVLARLRDLSGMAATIAVATGARPEACREAAQAIADMIGHGVQFPTAP